MALEILKISLLLAMHSSLFPDARKTVGFLLVPEMEYVKTCKNSWIAGLVWQLAPWLF